MRLDPLILSRIQFAWVIAWHILLPAFTLGAASYITVLEGLHLATGRAGLSPGLEFLDPDFRRRVRHGRGDGGCHAVPVRDQLEPSFGRRRERDRSIVGL